MVLPEPISILLVFDNIDVVIGTPNTQDIFRGMNADAVTSVDNSSYTSGGDTLTFSSLENLIGGTGNDNIQYCCQPHWHHY